MPGPSREIILRLYRDALSTPWGFRLQGGKDLKQPLSVQKVNMGSPVDGELCRGDVILEIQNCDATAMSHQKAQEMIKSAGGSLLLRVRRSGYHEPQSAPAPAGMAIPPGQQGFMLQRIQDTLSTSKFDPHEFSSSAAGYYDNKPLSSYRPNDHHHHLFTRPTGQQFASAQNATPRSTYPERMYGTLPRPKNTSQLPLGLSEPGWTPNLSIQRAPVTRTGRGRPHTYAQPPPPPPAVVAYNRPRSLEPEIPAWQGSLRSSMNPHLTDMRVDIEPHGGGPQQSQIAHFSPTQSPGQRHSSPWVQDSLGPGPRPVNLQYNSPLALYSKAAAEESLHGQKFGNAQVRSESDVYAMVHENDRRSANASVPYNHQAFDTSFTDF